MQHKHGLKRKADQHVEPSEVQLDVQKPRRRATVKRGSLKGTTDYTTLNLCFLRAVGIQLKQNPSVCLTGLFKQYEAHMGIKQVDRPFCIFEKKEGDGSNDKGLFENIFGANKKT